MYPMYTVYLGLLLVSTLVSAVPSRSLSPDADKHIRQRCKNPRERHEWRTLSDVQKADYIRAVRCLQTRPAKQPAVKEAKSRFDEFQAYHLQQGDFIHHVGQFLPWHRHFIQMYENALRDECGYKGRSPFWDWTLDADSSASLLGSPIFDPVTGFGGNGVPGTYTLPPNIPADQLVFPDLWRGCVQDGPFANYTVRLGPGKQITSHCLVRQIDNVFSVFLNLEAIANTSRSPTYETFRVELEGMPVTTDHRIHDGGHLAVGGEMSNQYSSPGDPIFYLHHANIDRVWAQWQQQNESRLYEISGSATFPPNDTENDLDWPLQMAKSIGPTIPIRKIMDIFDEYNCYSYV